MKKFINIFGAVIAMATNTFSQDDIYATAAANGHAAKLSNDVYRRLIDKTFEVMTPIQKATATQSLNVSNKTYKWVEGEIRVNNLKTFMDKSDVILGSDLKGPIKAYDIDENGYAKTYWIPLDSLGHNDKLISFGGMPYILIQGKHPYTAPEPLVVNSDIKVQVFKNPEPIVLPKAPEPIVTAPAPKTEGSPVIVNNIYNIVPGTSAYGGVEPRVYGSTAGVGGNYYGEQSRFGGNPSCNNYGNYGNYGSNAGVSLSVWWNSNPYYWQDNYWYCGKTHQRVEPQIYGQLCSQFGMNHQTQNYQQGYQSQQSTFGSGQQSSFGGTQSTVQSTVYGHR